MALTDQDMKDIRSKAKMIPMRMFFQTVEVVTFHDDAQALAEKIHEATGLRVTIWANEAEGDRLVAREKIGEVK